MDNVYTTSYASLRSRELNRSVDPLKHFEGLTDLDPRLETLANRSLWSYCPPPSFIVKNFYKVVECPHYDVVLSCELRSKTNDGPWLYTDPEAFYEKVWENFDLPAKMMCVAAKIFGAALLAPAASVSFWSALLVIEVASSAIFALGFSLTKSFKIADFFSNRLFSQENQFARKTMRAFVVAAIAATFFYAATLYPPYLVSRSLNPFLIGYAATFTARNIYVHVWQRGVNFALAQKWEDTKAILAEHTFEIPEKMQNSPNSAKCRISQLPPQFPVYYETVDSDGTREKYYFDLLQTGSETDLIKYLRNDGAHPLDARTSLDISELRYDPQMRKQLQDLAIAWPTNAV